MGRRDWLAALAVVAAAVACGGRVGTAPEVGAPADGGTDDVSVLDVGVTPIQDSSAPTDVTTTPDAPASFDAPDDAPASDGTALPAEASIDASMLDALVDAVEEPTVDAGRGCIDMCVLGDTQCDNYAVSCTDGDSTVCLHTSTVACVQGSSGCTEWGPEAACSAGVGCCSCHVGPCSDGGTSSCILCPSGPVGTPCTHDTDCGTDACDGVTHTCVYSQCHDHRQDGWETDVDCGGGGCQACGVGQQCGNNFDCQSGHFCAMPAHVCQ